MAISEAWENAAVARQKVESPWGTPVTCMGDAGNKSMKIYVRGG